MPYRLYLLLAVVFLQACSSITVLRTSELQAVGADVKQDMTRQLDSLRLEIDSLRVQNAALQNRLRAEVSAIHTRLGDDGERLNGKLEEVIYRLDMIMGTSEKILSKRVVVDKGANDSSVTTSSGLDLDVEKDYNNARADYHKGEYKLAYDGFKLIYEKMKTGEQAESALYWMGLCLAETNQPDKAQVVFQRVIDQFPTGSKTCVVHLKLAQMAEAKGETQKQTELLQKVLGLSQCAGTNEFHQAAERLQAGATGVAP